MLITLPLRLPSLANQRQHWAAKHRQLKLHREGAFYATLAALREAGYHNPASLPPLTIMLTRVAPRPLGNGNLEVAFKGVQDGVADAFAGEYLRGDDDDPRWTWRYAQYRSVPHYYAVEIALSHTKEALRHDP